MLKRFIEPNRQVIKLITRVSARMSSGYECSFLACSVCRYSIAMHLMQFAVFRSLKVKQKLNRIFSSLMRLLAVFYFVSKNSNIFFFVYFFFRFSFSALNNATNGLCCSSGWLFNLNVSRLSNRLTMWVFFRCYNHSAILDFQQLGAPVTPCMWFACNSFSFFVAPFLFTLAPMWAVCLRAASNCIRWLSLTN